MKKAILMFILFVVLTFGLTFFRFGTALTQERNYIPILISITKLELSGSGYEKILDQNNKLMYISKRDKYDIVKKFMKDRGWILKEQLGSGFIFEKSKEIIIIETRLYSKNYYLWTVPKKILNSNSATS